MNDSTVHLPPIEQPPALSIDRRIADIRAGLRYAGERPIMAPPVPVSLHANSVLERRIVWNLIRHLTANGFSINAVWDGEERTELLTERVTDPQREAMELTFNLDEVSLRFIPTEKRTLSRLARQQSEYRVLLVLGNGQDVLTDWSYSKDDADGFNAAMSTFDVERCL
jgi:hypothetical protein